MKKSFLVKILTCFATLMAFSSCGKKDTRESYFFTFEGTNCSAEYLDEYKRNEQVNIKITPNQYYHFSDEILVSGIDDYNFSVSTGILSFVMTNDVNVKCTCNKDNFYTVTLNLDHITSSEIKDSYPLSTPVTITLTPEYGYALPEQKDIDIKDGTIYSYNSGILSFYVTGNTVITASAIRIECLVNTNIVNATISELKDVYYKGDICSGTITPNKQYVLPNTITIEGDSVLNSYNQSTGEFEILINSTCTIKATAIYSPVPVTITSNLSHATISLSKQYNVYDTYNEIITPDINYLLPDQISVVGLENYTYNPSTGALSGYIISNVEITVSCNIDESKVSTYIFDGEYCSSDSVELIFIGDQFSVKISPFEGYKLPENVTVTGLKNGFTYNKSTGVVTGIVEENEINIECVAEEIITIVNFAFVGTNCSTTVLSQYESGSVIEFIIVPDFCYELPDSYEADGLTNISYDKSSGEFSATIEGNATLEIVANKITTTHNVSVIAENCKENYSFTSTYGDKVELKIAANRAYVLPVSIVSSSGCLDLEYDYTTGDLSFVVVDDVEIKLTAYYSPKEFNFTLLGDHVTCNAPSTLVEGDSFSYKLTPETYYICPEQITVTGLEDLSYNPGLGEVSGVVVGDVTITCDCVIDSAYYIPLKINCENCSIIDLPPVAVKYGNNIFKILVFNNCYLDNNSIEIVSGATSYNLSADSLYIVLDENASLVELNVKAVAKVTDIKFTGANCSMEIIGKIGIDQVCLARFITDEGYVLPDVISYAGIDVISYNKDVQILAFRFTSANPTISVTAIKGEKTYDSTMSNDDLMNHLSVLQSNLQNVTCNIVRNVDYYGDIIDSSNDVMRIKIDYNKYECICGNVETYSRLDNYQESNFDGYSYIYELGRGWSYEDYSHHSDAVSYIMSPLSALLGGEYRYYETYQCYASIIIGASSSYIYFKDGVLVAGFILMGDYFIYFDCSNFGTTSLNEFSIPQKRYYSLDLSCSNCNCKDTIYDSYEEGYNLKLTFEPYNNLVLEGPIIVEGLENYTYNPETGLLTGTIVGDVKIRVGAH